MSEATKSVYSPALRMKKGELEGVRQLATDVADRILPRFIVPPSGERDEEISLFEGLDRVPDVSSLLADVWPRRPVLIDPTYILDEFGRARDKVWLPRMFERARAKELSAVPAALLSDVGACLDPLRASIEKNYQIKFGLIVPYDEMVGSEFAIAMNAALRSLDLSPADCAVIADFGTADFTDPRIVAPIIGGALETLQDVGLWRQIIFQGSNYPARNPAADGGVELWPRTEWHAWRLAVKFDPTTADHMIFGDYAADCSKIDFAKSRGRPIPHLRYTTGENWRIQRGANDGTGRDRMHPVYTHIVGSSDFAGAGFSEADRYIARAAASAAAPHGNPSTWRQLNTTHHITQVVSDIARVRGFEIKRRPVEESVQSSLLTKI